MLGDWGKILTKTPILVLFIVLISMGVGTASALITITLAGNVIVTGDLDVAGDTVIDGHLKMGTNDPNNDDIIFFDSGVENLTWDESENRFDFSNDVVCPNCILGFYSESTLVTIIEDDLSIANKQIIAECDDGDLVINVGTFSQLSIGGEPFLNVSGMSALNSNTGIATFQGFKVGEQFGIKLLCADFDPSHFGP